MAQFRKHLKLTAEHSVARQLSVWLPRRYSEVIPVVHEEEIDC